VLYSVSANIMMLKTKATESHSLFQIPQITN